MRAKVVSAAQINRSVATLREGKRLRSELETQTAEVEKLTAKIVAIDTKKAEAAPAEPTTKECPHCFTTIPIKATRCPHCTSELRP